MTTNKIRTQSTSMRSANADDIVLREKVTTRLIFRPLLVQNSKEATACVRGVFIFQRKGINDQWETITDTILTKLRKGEGIKLELHTGELLKFFQGISDLYQVGARYGIPQGTQTFFKANERLQELVQAFDNLTSDELNQLKKLDLTTLRHLTTLSGIVALREALDMWDKNCSNPDEGFWQSMFTKRQYLLAHLFSCPMVLLGEQSYVGGKTIHNSEGKLADFLYKNELTRNVTIIEIKTPVTPILSTKYRNNIYNPSSELTGAVLQVLNYRKSLIQDLNNLIVNSNEKFEACEPPCKVIIGKTTELDDDRDKIKSFELLRNSLSNVEIIAYDELFLRLKRLLDLLGQHKSDP